MLFDIDDWHLKVTMPALNRFENKAVLSYDNGDSSRTVGMRDQSVIRHLVYWAVSAFIALVVLLWGAASVMVELGGFRLSGCFSSPLYLAVEVPASTNLLVLR
jgi:hypothetical protein